MNRFSETPGQFRGSHIDLRSGADQTIRSLSVSRLTNRRDIACDISSDIRVIITAYRTKKISDDHPYNGG
jgi:hypothetical protein